MGCCTDNYVRKTANVLVGVAIFLLLGSVILSAAAHLTTGSITDYQNKHWTIRGLWKECDHYDISPPEQLLSPTKKEELICESYYTKGAEVARVFLITDHIVCLLTVPFLLLLGLLVMHKYQNKQQQQQQQSQRPQQNHQQQLQQPPRQVKWQQNGVNKQGNFKISCTSFVVLVPILAALHCVLLGIVCGVMTHEYLNIANTHLMWGTVVPWIGWALSLINIIITCFIYLINLRNSECHGKKSPHQRPPVYKCSTNTANTSSTPESLDISNPQSYREITTSYNYECKYSDPDSSSFVTL
ncbi:uncharacterized protein LOC142348319 [Convolutriloba macropyga]|uniref:uncharacterized protein LOC142348319 n=1 Tax=Convolutriloba macropyga TaxID=536237 RepID=UPI003F51D5F4